MRDHHNEARKKIETLQESALTKAVGYDRITSRTSGKQNLAYFTKTEIAGKLFGRELLFVYI